MWFLTLGYNLLIMIIFHTSRKKISFYVSPAHTATSGTPVLESAAWEGGRLLAGTGAAPAAPYLDFGARLYCPGTATWLSVDPMAEKYYGIGSLTYCAGSPVNLVDPTGESTFVYFDSATGGYTVFGGEVNDDLYIYEYFADENGAYTIRGGSIGESWTPTSFYHSEENRWEGHINPNELEGARF